MNGEIGDFILKPDQMQVVNPLLILAFIPLFEWVSSEFQLIIVLVLCFYIIRHKVDIENNIMLFTFKFKKYTKRNK